MQKYRISETDIPCNNLPSEFNGFKIAHLSDLHSHVQEGISADVNAFAPDIIVITGDILNHACYEFDRIYRLLSELAVIAPVYTVSGNHDLRNRLFGDFVRKIASFGINFIDDRFLALEKSGAKIGIFGIKDPNVFKSSELDRSLTASLGALPKFDGFKLLLLHRADLFPRIFGFDLVLSGHMHGGQICLPNGRGVLSPKSSIIGVKKPFFPDYTAGLYTKDNCTMYVSRGLSNPTLLPRIFNRTELALLTLKGRLS